MCLDGLIDLGGNALAVHDVDHGNDDLVFPGRDLLVEIFKDDDDVCRRDSIMPRDVCWSSAVIFRGTRLRLTPSSAMVLVPMPMPQTKRMWTAELLFAIILRLL